MGFYGDFLAHRGRQADKWTHYFPIYEKHFERFRNQSATIIEIGAAGGGSLQLWKSYLGPFAQIVGLDIHPGCKKSEEAQIAVRIGDQSDMAFLKSVVEEFGQPDIVIDDGSHVMEHINASFDFLYPRVSKNGVYLVEDLHTAYSKDHNGGQGRSGTFIERCKVMIDELHAEYWTGKSTEFSASTRSMHFYDSVVVFERGQHVKKHAVKCPP
jgi:hypothetical protein